VPAAFEILDLVAGGAIRADAIEIARADRRFAVAAGNVEHIGRLAQPRDPSAQRPHQRLPLLDARIVDPATGTERMGDLLAVDGVIRAIGTGLSGACPAGARIVDAGIPMLSQSVLLRGVNDDAAALGELMRALVECRIKPYYLHHGDLAPGTAHWRTGIEEGQTLMRALQGRLSGLCQPIYVLDIPGGHGKSPIGPSYLDRVGGTNGTARYEVEDFNGRRHAYPPTA